MLITKTVFSAVDSTEAPDGFYAVAKSSVVAHNDNQNICRFCDWRSSCDPRVCGCMDYNRADGFGVVFKKK